VGGVTPPEDVRSPMVDVLRGLSILVVVLLHIDIRIPFAKSDVGVLIPQEINRARARLQRQPQTSARRTQSAPPTTTSHLALRPRRFASRGCRSVHRPGELTARQPQLARPRRAAAARRTAGLANASRGAPSRRARAPR